MAKRRAFTCRGAPRRSRPATATTRATSTGPQTSRACRRTRMARTTTCSWSRCCAATRSRPTRSGKARTSATGAGSSARTMTVWREALTGPCRRGRALTTHHLCGLSRDPVPARVHRHIPKDIRWLRGGCGSRSPRQRHVHTGRGAMVKCRGISGAPTPFFSHII
jgi:hypothetical protein